MKNIYFVQVGFAFDRSLYLPFAAGAVAAYSLADPKIKNEYEFKEFIFKRERLDAVVARLENPFIVAFSNYIWNYEFNKALAERVKAAYPACITVFGGHSVSESGELLNEEQGADILMFGEGEEPFHRLLCALSAGEELSCVPNIAFRCDGKTVKTPREYYDNIDGYPSAMLSGVFDSILEANPDTDFLGVLETNRGCPYNCAYCDWCAGKRVRKFPMERIKAEIDWLSAHRIEYCFCADSNFGFFERDLEIVDYIVEAKRKTGYPKVFRPCYAKNSGERVFEICRRLNTYGMDKGATMAYQTLSASALENINRKNLTMEHFSSLLAMYNEAGIPSYSELILGLPGETYESFCAGLCRLLDAGQHNSVSVYYCEMLPNSPMSEPEYIEKFSIKTARVPFNHIHSAAHHEEVEEFSTLIVETASLSHADWIRANLFSVCVQSFHNLGLLRCFALWLHYENGVEYLDFYNALLEFIFSAEATPANQIFVAIREKLSDESGCWNYRNELFGEAEWFLEEGVFLEAVLDLDRFYDGLRPFLKGFDIPKEIFDGLLAYQRGIIRLPAKRSFSLGCDYDFYSYFNGVYVNEYAPLERVKNSLDFSFEDNSDNACDFAREVVWYGRRRGATLATSGKKYVVQKRLTQ